MDGANTEEAAKPGRLAAAALDLQNYGHMPAEMENGTARAPPRSQR